MPSDRFPAYAPKLAEELRRNGSVAMGVENAGCKMYFSGWRIFIKIHMAVYLIGWSVFGLFLNKLSSSYDYCQSLKNVYVTWKLIHLLFYLLDKRVNVFFLNSFYKSWH